MSKDSKTTPKSAWEEFARILCWIAIVVTLVLSCFYLLLWSPNLENRGIALGLALIPNLVSVCFIYAVSYVIFGRYQLIKSREERGEFATEVAHKVQAVVGSDLDIMQQTMNKFLVHSELGNTAHSLGVADITSNWINLTESQQALGANFRTRLSNVKSPATWYSLTMTPSSALRGFDDAIRNAVKRGVNIKWVYYAAKTTDINPALRTQIEYLSRSANLIGSDGRVILEARISGLLDDFGTSLRNEIYKLRKEDQKNIGNLEFYESEMAHPYLAFLSVPEEYKELTPPPLLQDTLPQNALPNSAPAGTFGFVKPYTIFPLSYEERPALYLDAPGGKFLDEYYWSTVRLFDWGVRLGKIRCTWSLKART
jgi:hypothetical protein